MSTLSSTQDGVNGMMGYQYDADGNRVGKGTITSMSCDLTSNGYQPTTDYVLDLDGSQETEVSILGKGGPVWQHTNVTADGMLIATYDSVGIHYYLDDALGSRRVQVDAAGVVEQTCQSLPFGDQLFCSQSTTTPSENHFTGKERDSESGLDYFGARYYASSMGRWMSPDWADKPEAVPYSSLDDPQSLNLYGYVRNNPLSKADPDGHCDWCNTVRSWLSSGHSASASGSKSAGQASASNGGLSVGVKAGTASASASASYGANTSVGAKASASVAEATISEGSHSTTQMNGLTANANANVGVGANTTTGIGVSAGAGANADVMTASQTEKITIGPVTISVTATGAVGIGANASASVGTGGVSASAGVTPGVGGAISGSITWNGVSATGGVKSQSDMNGTKNTVKQPEIKPQQ